MASHFAFHSEAHETVPLQAQYGFPSQATRTLKTTVKLTPRDGGPYGPGSIIRIDFPAQGYLDAINTTLRFGVSAWPLSGTGSPAHFLRLHNNANTCFNRLRLLYGSIVLEDIQDYNVLVRMLTNATVADDYYKHTGAVYEGMGSEIQRIRVQSRALVGKTTEDGVTFTPNTTKTFAEDSAQFFQIHLLSGILTQMKLVPLKWMASQLRIELYCAPAQQVLIAGNPASISHQTRLAFDTEKTDANNDDKDGSNPATLEKADGQPVLVNGDRAEVVETIDGTTTINYVAFTRNNEAGAQTLTYNYAIGKVELIAQILEFDENYDAAAVQGLASHGIPIHFTSWHSFPFAVTGTNAQYAVQERAKSIKAAFACILNNDLMTSTTHESFLFDSFATSRLNITEYIWRVGGKYFPAQPVITSGGAIESFVELQKALNLLGNYEAGCQITPELYGSFTSGNTVKDYFNGADVNSTEWALGDKEYLGGIDHPRGKHLPIKLSAHSADYFSQGACSMFMIGTSFEATPGREISGINGEEQNEILLRLTRQGLNGAGLAAANKENNTLYVFILYDALMVVRLNNTVDLIQ